MEEGERDEGSAESHTGLDVGPIPSEVQIHQLSGFADKFVAGILKESIEESGVEPIWSITCSSDCHNHTKAIPGVDGEKSLARMQLCWTPESPVAPSSPSQAPCQSHCRHQAENAGETQTNTLIRKNTQTQSSIHSALSRIDENPPRCSISRSNIICQKSHNCDVISEVTGESIESSPIDSEQSVDNEQLSGWRDEGNKSPESAANRHTVADCESPEHPKYGESLGENSATLASAKEYLQELSGSGRRFSKEQLQGSLSDPSDIIAQSAEHLAVDHFHTEENGCSSSSLRKGMSVNDVTCGAAIEGIGVTKFISEDFSSGDLSPKNSKRVGFLRQLGRGLRRNREEEGVEPERSKKGIRSFRKTLSSLFSLKGKWRDEADQETGRGKRPTSAPVVGIFKLPARRSKNVPPSKRALPPVPSMDSIPNVSVDLLPRPPGTPDTLAPLTDESSEIRELDEGDWPVVAENSPEQGGREGEPTNQMKFASSIEKVKDQGWYWGPISGEAAEKILAKEPDGSFVVRDSSDHHYIFSLTFKLNGFVRHVRIEHDQGNFSFGSFTKFKSNTIVDFIENAVEHSRSGRYLFFLHRRPVLGPMRVQLLHPVSRFKEVQSLQHMCRYVIVKHVRRDLLNQLPVPTRMKQYLNTPFYYSEQVAEEAENNPNMHAMDQHDAFFQFADEANQVDQLLDATRDEASVDDGRLFNSADSTVNQQGISHTVPNSEILDTSIETGDFFLNTTPVTPNSGQTQLSSLPVNSGVVDSCRGTCQVDSWSLGGTNQKTGNQAVLTNVQGNTEHFTDYTPQPQTSETYSDRVQPDEVKSTDLENEDESSGRT